MNRFVAVLLLSLFSCSLAQHCVDPKFSDFKTATTVDAKINTETSYVLEFKVQCSNNAKNVLFFTELNGNLIASSVDSTGTKYQLAWTQTHKNAQSGTINVRIFDEEGFSALKKAQRNNEDLSKVKELKVASVYHPGSYKGPYFQSELLVVALFGAVFYWAFATKSEIQA